MMTQRRLMTIILASTFSITLIPSAALAQTGSSTDKTLKPIRIGFVRNRDSFDGAGCSLQLAADYKRQNKRYIFVSDYEDNAVLNIDGKDTSLRLVSHREPRGDLKRGSRETWNYSADGIKVRVDFLVTGLCPPKCEGCEVVYYDATITVTRGSDKQVAYVKGLCGS